VADFFHHLCYSNLTRRMKNRHLYFLILLIQISAVELILQEETPTKTSLK